METLKDIWASLVAHIHERTSNPLTFAFLLSWLGWNYKFVVYLFDNETAANRLTSIQGMYPQNLNTYLGSAFGYPFLTACFFVFVWPFITEQVVKFYRWRQIVIANTLKVVEQERVISQKQATEMLRRHEIERNKDAEEFGRFEATIDALRTALSTAEAELLKVKSLPITEAPSTQLSNEVVSNESISKADLSPQPLRNEGSSENTANLDDNLKKVLGTPQQIAILKVMSDAPNPQSPDSISAASKINFTVTQLHLEELQKLKLVVGNQTVRGPRWGLTSPGRSFVVAAGIVS